MSGIVRWAPHPELLSPRLRVMRSPPFIVYLFLLAWSFPPCECATVYGRPFLRGIWDLVTVTEVHWNSALSLCLTFQRTIASYILVAKNPSFQASTSSEFFCIFLVFLLFAFLSPSSHPNRLSSVVPGCLSFAPDLCLDGSRQISARYHAMIFHFVFTWMQIAVQFVFFGWFFFFHLSIYLGDPSIDHFLKLLNILPLRGRAVIYVTSLPPTSI